MSWFIYALKNYLNFSDRARRKEYWMFFLFYMIFVFVFAFLDTALGKANSMEEALDLEGLFSPIYAIAMLIPSIAVTVRRLHDTNRSGWWILISLVPVIGILVLVFFTVLNSDEGFNRFGRSPKAEPAF
ncbi:hypothetical protein CHH28_14710 [Bacterioplanes sanyensis]|uniref:DUF805 domain-containing protein n=1 Tax=Bacterioplanes sanyensis TaxID=1249553 RepID=A0A222FLF6_9GAMM|nr:DUF805 domain-containing protein [Bacterioplanes sanyensis]ASP39848.1 hypothetical protein CHH28_14710 [Bacterioplanes sanyensis]